MCHCTREVSRGRAPRMSPLLLLMVILYLTVGIRKEVCGHEFKIGPCQFQYLEPCTSKTIAFYVFSSDHPGDGPILLDSIDPRVPEHIMLNQTNKLIVHGYGGSIDFNATKRIRKAYLRKPHTNVFIVDWGKLSRLPCYPTAAFNTKQAGECTATFLIGLQANHPEFSSRDLHAIGFSLGAHVLSFTSNALEKSIGVKFRRITGLDPALPFFATARPHWKLDQGDADFVDVIHTNAGVYGKIETCGHVDFYMNGGQNQPGCENDSNQPLCSHKMAAAYFAESINSKHGFWATRCSSYFAYFFGFCKYRVEQQQQQQSLIDGSDRGSRRTDRSQEEEQSVTAFGENNNDFDSNRILMGEYCSNTDIRFYLFTRSNPDDRQYIHIDESWEKSNLSSSYFNPSHPVKVIIHGYNADMFLTPLINMKGEYLSRGNYNLIFVDWSDLAHGPCYPSAVHNTRHVGSCIGQMINRIIDAGTDNVHLIGFSLGAQVTNYVSTTVRPFRIRRITGLDPAMPLFITAAADDKLDPTDAEFVDVIHTNALVQGKIERCGHVDFYVNGGIMQPGCWGSGQNPMACSHHRAPDYYAESIRSLTGFWGWSCQSYVYYLLGFCPQNERQIVAGEDCPTGTEGMFMITTNAASPFAIGRWTGFSIPQKKDSALHKHGLSRDPFISDIDQWGKLDGSFNNVEQFPTPYSQDPNHASDDEWPYFNHVGTKQQTRDHIQKILEQDKSRYNGDRSPAIASNTLATLAPTAPFPSPTGNEVDEDRFYLEDLRRRLQQKEASVMQQYSMPMFNAY
ncbi:uncharacterized protein LOC126573332 [Anopheles aquasalis]|uniref:uncharacterized protein LOC126573332 n=1 Tax=Anopheles aquasalis TaxID=42839 RepID=UPI00215A9952|nr:uncharacterized protein LOC126573332 [Anopheles aquasalis]